MNTQTPNPRAPLAAVAVAAALLLGACGEGGSGETSIAKGARPAAATTAPEIPVPVAADGKVTLRNCGTELTLPSPAQRIFANDGNIISIVLAAGAAKQIAAVSSVQRDLPVLARHYGQDVVDGLRDVSKEYPSKETVLAQRPDVFFAGWNYGFDEATGLTPAGLAARDVAAYTLTESCRQGKGRERGIVDPWTALRTDLVNIGAVTGNAETAAEASADIDARLRRLQSAPQARKPPVIFLFDSGSKTIYSSGNLGAPHAIIEAAGGRNALEQLRDTWTEVSWEKLVESRPDAFLFVDYPPQTAAQKIALLEGRAGVKDLPAVREKRYLNLPYALWTSGPLNIDAAEQARRQLEAWGLVPRSGLTPKFDDTAALDR